MPRPRVFFSARTRTIATRSKTSPAASRRTRIRDLAHADLVVLTTITVHPQQAG
jgi:hypothetical protein